MHVSDYTEKSLLGILNEVKATVLVSLINDANPTFIVRVHTPSVAQSTFTHFRLRLTVP